MREKVEMVAETYCFCRKCAYRIELDHVRVGAILSCPACGFEFTTGPSPSSMVTGQGRTGPWNQLPPLQHLVSRLFTLSFLQAIAWRTAGVAIGIAGAIAAIQLAIWCLLNDRSEMDASTRILLWNGLWWSFAFGAIIVPVALWSTSAYGVTILRETSEGSDAPQPWPRLLALEGLGESGFVVNSLFLSVIPAIPIIIFYSWHSPHLIVLASIWLFFPIFLLSMLTMNSYTHVAASLVWKSLIWAWQGWLCFYLSTLAIMTLLIVVEATFANHKNTIVAIILRGALLAATWMLYCRLLGRLAWYCSARLEKEDESASAIDDWPRPSHHATRPPSARSNPHY